MRHDHIKVFISRFRKGKSPPFHQIGVGIGSSRLQSWAGYTMSTAEWPEHFNSEVELLEEIAYCVPSCCFWSA